MLRVQRKFGKILPRTADEAQVGQMLHDFQEADRMLGTLIESAKHWRDAWSDILKHQLSVVNTYDSMYQPLSTGTQANQDIPVRQPAETPEDAMERVRKLHELYESLKTDMEDELSMVNSRLIQPAESAKEHIKPMKKVIKAREDRKLDYEHYRSRVEHAQKKTKRSDRENSALEKYEADQARTLDDYERADENLRNNLPYITAACMNLLPHLLANQIMIQNSLLGNFYTILNEYSEEYGFPPPQEPEEIAHAWDATHTPLRLDLETNYRMIANGKAVRQPMQQDYGSGAGATVTGLGIRNRVTGAVGRRKSDNGNGTPPPARLTSTPSHDSSSTVQSPPPPSMSTKPKISSSNSLATPDSYNNSRRPSTTSTLSTTSTPDYISQRKPSSSSIALSGAAAAAAIAAKKKAPPPPPKKIGSYQSEFVTAMYDFEGEGEGDLSFREGDRIRVVKKTGSSHDWWEGELGGMQGSFPANYTR